MARTKAGISNTHQLVQVATHYTDLPFRPQQFSVYLYYLTQLQLLLTNHSCIANPVSTLQPFMCLPYLWSLTLPRPSCNPFPPGLQRHYTHLVLFSLWPLFLRLCALPFICNSLSASQGSSLRPPYHFFCVLIDLIHTPDLNYQIIN